MSKPKLSNLILHSSECVSSGKLFLGSDNCSSRKRGGSSIWLRRITSGCCLFPSFILYHVCVCWVKFISGIAEHKVSEAIFVWYNQTLSHQRPKSQCLFLFTSSAFKREKWCCLGCCVQLYLYLLYLVAENNVPSTNSKC